MIDGQRAGRPPVPHISVCDPITWQDRPVPERRWLVDDLIPLHNVTLLSGDGGIGKSLIALQLLVACALGRPWLGQPTLPCKAFALFCEDDEGELHRRLVNMTRHYDAELGDLENLQLCTRVGLENSLMDWKSHWETGETTWLHAEIMNHALEFGAQILVVDSLHDVFAGEENRRVHVRQFIQGLREIAREIDGAVLLTGHPSLAGRAAGTGESGSTAWNNSVRARLYLTAPGEEGVGDERILKNLKANYAPRGGEIRLKWSSGVYEPIPEQAEMVCWTMCRTADLAFLRRLDNLRREGREVSDQSRTSNYAPRVFEKRPEATGYAFKALELAMERLFARGAIRCQSYGPRPSRQFVRIVRVEPAPADGETDSGK